MNDTLLTTKRLIGVAYVTKLIRKTYNNVTLVIFPVLIYPLVNSPNFQNFAGPRDLVTSMLAMAGSGSGIAVQR